MTPPFGRDPVGAKPLKERFGLAPCTSTRYTFDYTAGPALDDDQLDTNQTGGCIGTNGRPVLASRARLTTVHRCYRDR